MEAEWSLGSLWEAVEDQLVNVAERLLDFFEAVYAWALAELIRRSPRTVSPPAALMVRACVLLLKQLAAGSAQEASGS